MTETQQDLMAFEKLTKMKESFFKEIGKVIIGQENILEHLLITLLSQGHTLLVGVPGLAKTLIIKTLSDILDLSFKRIQFTPDLMPSDITGTELIDIDNNTGQRSFRFFKGPVFANIVLADEINRTPPKTQSALLEAMQEHKVTAGGKSYDLDEPFFVMGNNTLLLSRPRCSHFIFKISLLLIPVSIAKSIMGHKYQTLVLEDDFFKRSYSPGLNLLSLGGLFLGSLIF